MDFYGYLWIQLNIEQLEQLSDAQHTSGPDRAAMRHHAPILAHKLDAANKEHHLYTHLPSTLWVASNTSLISFPQRLRLGGVFSKSSMILLSVR